MVSRGTNRQLSSANGSDMVIKNKKKEKTFILIDVAIDAGTEM